MWLVAMLPGCVLPLQFEEEVDGGIDRDYPPVLVSTTPPMPGFTSIDTTQPSNIYMLEVDDKDVSDRLFIRVFRDYNPVMGMTSPPIATKTVEAGLDIRRHVELNTGVWCNNVTQGTRSTYDIVIADRPFLEDENQAPYYQAVPEGAQSIHGYWVITCE